MEYVLLSILLLWLAAGAVYDVRNRHIPLLLDWPPIVLALIGRATVHTVGYPAPWWQIGVVTAFSVGMWSLGWLGGADSRAWITVTALGGLPLLAAVVSGAAISFPVLKRTLPDGVPGFPGFALGMGVFFIARLFIH